VLKSVVLRLSPSFGSPKIASKAGVFARLLRDVAGENNTEDWVAVDAVRCELLSLLSGKITANLLSNGLP
jgi:hypothetical protein